MHQLQRSLCRQAILNTFKLIFYLQTLFSCASTVVFKLILLLVAWWHMALDIANLLLQIRRSFDITCCCESEGHLIGWCHPDASTIDKRESKTDHDWQGWLVGCSQYIGHILEIVWPLLYYLLLRFYVKVITLLSCTSI